MNVNKKVYRLVLINNSRFSTIPFTANRNFTAGLPRKSLTSAWELPGINPRPVLIVHTPTTRGRD